MLLRQNVTLDLLENSSLKTLFRDLVLRLEENKVLNFYSNYLQYQRKINARELLIELEIGRSYQKRMLKYRRDCNREERGFKKCQIKTLKSTYYQFRRDAKSSDEH